MELTKELVNQGRFKIKKNGTFTIDQKDIIKSDKFKAIVDSLKPVTELNNCTTCDWFNTRCIDPKGCSLGSSIELIDRKE